MSRKTENTGFICENCGKEVLPLKNGSYRNHCCFCLCSKHVDILPGDRNSNCGGIMDPVSVEYKTGKGWQIVHKCRICGSISRNIVALDDAEQPDDITKIASLSAEK